jgi:hypothetical protein
MHLPSASETDWEDRLKVCRSAQVVQRMILMLFVLFACAAPAVAHDVPNDVRVQMYFKPVGKTLQLLVRMPLTAMQEVDFPRRGPGYLDIARADEALATSAKLWIADSTEIYEGENRLPYPRIAAVRVSLPSDRSFVAFESAMTHFGEPRLPDNLNLYWNQGMLDVLFEYPIGSDQSAFSIEPKYSRLGVQVVTGLQFLPTQGASRAFEFHGNPGLIRLDPSWSYAAFRFVKAGFLHILDGTDHLLFILCLVIPFRGFRTLALIVTAFTLAHSITLIASAFGLAPEGLWFPPLVETLIAASILYMALENIVGSSAQRRWMIAFVFGLVHGFGFSFALRETLQFAGSHLVTSLLSFNVGVELGQLLVLAILIPLLNLLFRFVPERAGTIVISALVAHTAWHWLAERWEKLAKFPWPEFDAGTLAAAMRWAIVLLTVGAALGWLNRKLERRRDAVAKPLTPPG